MRRLAGAAGALVLVLAGAAAAPVADDRFVVDLPPAEDGGVRAPMDAAREALPVLWARLLPEGVAAPAASPLAFVERIVPRPDGGVRVVFQRRAVLDWLRAHGVPHLAAPVRMDVRLRVLDAFGPRPDWRQAARAALEAAAAELGIERDEAGTPVRIVGYVEGGVLVLDAEPETEERRVPVADEAALRDPAFWRDALAPVLAALRDRFVRPAEGRLQARAAASGWGCIRLRFARPWSPELRADTQRLLASVAGVQAAPARLAHDGVTYRLELADRDARARLQAALEQAGWVVEPALLGLEAR